MTRRLALLGLAAACLCPAWAQAAADPLSAIKDPAGAWTVGFCRLSADGPLSAAAQGLRSSLPKRWRDAFKGELVHSLGEAERGRRAADLLEQARNAVRADIDGQVARRDAAWLAGGLTDQARAGADKALADARAKLAALLRAQPGGVKVAARQALSLADAGADQVLLDPVDPADPGAPDRLSADKKLQTLVYGSLSEEGGYVFLTARAWDAQRRVVVWELAQAMPADEAEARAEDQIEGMASALLGYRSAGVAIETDQPGSLIVLRPAHAEGPLYRDVGKAGFRFLEPGEYKLQVKADGYALLERSVVLEPGRNHVLRLKLEAEARRFVAFDSQPSGAAVYMFSRYQGTTPLRLPLPDERTTLSVELPGYQRLQETIGPDSPDSDTVSLVRDVINWSNEFQLRRDRLYDSLAWLALSVIPPVLFNGLYMNYATHAAGGYGTQSDVDAANLCYYLRIATLFLTGVAIVDVGVKIGDYLEAADYLSGRK